MARGRDPSRTPDLFPSLTQLSFLQPAGKPEIALATRQPCPYNQPHEPFSAVGLSAFAWAQLILLDCRERLSTIERVFSCY
jgi:hypothetical protein